MGIYAHIPQLQAEYNANSLVSLIDRPACIYSPYKRVHIAHNTEFEILFKGKHPLDIIGQLPENIKFGIGDGDIVEKTVFRNIELEGKRFSAIEIVPFYRDYILKFRIQKPFTSDYEQIFEIIFEKSPVGIVMFDKNSKFIAANSAIADITGYSKEELRNMTFHDITHVEDAERNEPLIRKLYSEELDTFSIQKRYIRKNGSIIWVNLLTSLTKDLNGEFLGGIGIVEDITEKVEIEKQRDVLLQSLREKNKEIVDSLAYARNIQNTLLPRNNEFKKFFPKHFIYYCPKDIVGGDFYWIRSSGDLVYFAVADCTGHGVPGAFISLIGNYRLNMIFEKFKGADPGVILDKLNNIIAYSFRNSKYSISNHGMDIVVCSYNLKTKMLKYAGANNSLLVVRKGIGTTHLDEYANTNHRLEEDILELKPVKHPIGTYSGKVNFTTNDFKIKKGDRIYLYSDGYQDQFGGEKAKKLKIREFKNLLLREMKSDFMNQSKTLHEFRKEWQGYLQQVDDICVVGIEF